MVENQSAALAAEEYRALKNEILLRIAIQNTTIITAVFAFIVCIWLRVIEPEQAALVAFFQSIAVLALTLIWCHQGVRQCALKQAILAHDAAAKRETSWENWLPSQRPSSLLGSRWFVSTKAVFLGLNIALILTSLQHFTLYVLG